MFIAAGQPYPDDIKPLTALRFFAAMMIVLFHYTLLLPFSASSFTGLLAKGYLATDFFFILSGFILSHVYLAAASAGRLKAGAFYARRLARIYPVHLFTLGVALLPCAAAVLGGVPELAAGYFRYAISHALMLHAWGVDGRLILNVPSWSVSAEWFAYLLFPLLAVFICRAGPRLTLALAALLYAVFYIFIALLPDEGGHFMSGRLLTERTFDFGIIRILPAFIMGMALYRFGCAWQLRGNPRPMLVACALLLAGLTHCSVPDFVILPLFAVLILLVAECARQGMAGFLDRPLWVRLGESSYSLYMVHYLWLDLIFTIGLQTIYGDGVPPAGIFWPFWLALFPLALWSADWCHRRIEAPGRQYVWVRLMNINVYGLKRRG